MRPNTLNLTDYPFADVKVTSREARRLGELHDEAAERIAAVRAVRAEAAAALAAVGAASEALTAGLEAEAAGEKVDTARLTAKLREAEKRAGEPWAQRIEAAERIAGRAVTAYETFGRTPEVAAALHAAALPFAYADEAAVIAAFETLAVAVENHQRHEQRMNALAVLCGHVPREELPTWSQPPSPKRLREQARGVPCVYPARYAPAPEPLPEPEPAEVA